MKYQPQPLTHVDTWVFDLDNTLYPAGCNLFAQIDQRMTAFIAQFFDIDPVKARVIQKDYYRRHGATLRGLMNEHELDPFKFLDFVHDIDHSALPDGAALSAALGNLEGRKIVFTNGSEKHAENVMRAMGVDHHFDGIYDIVASEYRPKPAEEPYDDFLKRFAIDPTSAIFFEDSPHNLKPAHDRGMTCVWVPGDDVVLQKYASRQAVEEAEYVHHIVEDLPVWLAEVNNLRRG